MRPLLALSAMAATMSVIAAGQDQRPLFRASSDLIAVPVRVDRNNSPVLGLTAGDFELRDNGVVQTIELLADATTPVDVTLVVDTSGSVGREIGRFRDDLERLAELFDPDDRVRVLAFESAVRELIPLVPANSLPPPAPLVARGGTALDDAVAAALIDSRSDGRRQLIAVLIGGADNASGVDTGRLLDLAGRSHAALHTYSLDHTPASGILAGFERRSWLERQNALELAATRTGGAPHNYRNSAFNSLRDLIDEFRRSYVLYFRPSQPPDSAWHDLKVDVRGDRGGGVAVRARPGYVRASGEGPSDVAGPVVAAPVASPSSASEPRAAMPRAEVTADSMAARFDRYEEGEHVPVAAELRLASNADDVPGLIRREGQRWIEAGPSGSGRRRRVVVAALALEVARPAHSLPGAAPTTERPFLWSESFRLMLWGGSLLAENLTVTDAERAWYLAAIAGFQGMQQFRRSMAGWREAQALLDQAMARDPDEGRYRWAHAILLEQQLEDAARARVTVPLVVLRQNQTSYEAAGSRGDDDLRAEIQVHIVARFLRANEDMDEALGPMVDRGRREAAKEALGRLAYAEGIADERFLVYMCRFLRGRIHDRLDQRPEAEAAYRSALDVYPRAQSASMALATLLFLRGEEDGARRLVANVLASGATGAGDPWGVLYPHQDYRRLPMYIDQMRAALRAGR